MKNIEKELSQFFLYLDNIEKISQKEENELKEKISFRKIKKGEIFLKEGEIEKEIAFITKGVVRYYYIDKEGHDWTKYFIDENNLVLSLFSVIEKKPSKFYIEAIEDSELLIIKTSDLYELFRTNEYYKYIYVNALKEYFIEKEKREAEFLINDAKGRYLNFLNEYKEIASRVKQHHIASFMGITPVSLSRIISQLKIS